MYDIWTKGSKDRDRTIGAEKNKLRNIINKNRNKNTKLSQKLNVNLIGFPGTSISTKSSSIEAPESENDDIDNVKESQPPRLKRKKKKEEIEARRDDKALARKKIKRAARKAARLARQEDTDLEEIAGILRQHI